MKLLLDSHTCLWFLFGDLRVRPEIRELIADEANEKFLSIASAWEIAIKVSTGKLLIGQSLDLFLTEQLRRNAITLLPVTLPHILKTSQLPYHHRDPFDRILVAQSLTEPMPLISADTILDAYGIHRL